MKILSQETRSHGGGPAYETAASLCGFRLKNFQIAIPANPSALMLKGLTVTVRAKPSSKHKALSNTLSINLLL